MNAIIIYFSPSGNTGKIAMQLENAFTVKSVNTKIIDLTRNDLFWNSTKYRDDLYNSINQCDILCVGAPVYAHHLHYNMLNFIKKLKPVDKIQYAVPFVSYGGINSGEALHEAEKLLKKQGRSVVGGLKVNSEHSLSKAFKTDFNRNLPGDSALTFINELVNKITSIEAKKIIPAGDFMNYQKPSVRIRTKLLIGEKFWHKHMYPKVSFDEVKCNQCGICASKCPLMRIQMDNFPKIKDNAPDCIHCGLCVFSCKQGGVKFDADMGKWEKMFIKATLGKGPLVSNEEPKTTAYYCF
jgi:ferredoxin/flavodoxin